MLAFLVDWAEEMEKTGGDIKQVVDPIYAQMRREGVMAAMPSIPFDKKLMQSYKKAAEKHPSVKQMTLETMAAFKRMLAD